MNHRNKRRSAVFAAGIMMLSLAACTGKDTPEDVEDMRQTVLI